MIKLKRLKILKYRNVKPGTELHFDDGVNLILGQNASGKTTLLALISAVCRGSFTGLADEEFELEFQFDAEGYEIQGLVSHARKDVPTTIDIPEPGSLWEDAYLVTFIRRDTRDGHYASSGHKYQRAISRDLNFRSLKSLAPRTELMMEWSFMAAALTNGNAELSELRTELLQDLGSVYRFDESLDAFASITGRSRLLLSPAAPPSTFLVLAEQQDPQGGVSVSRASFVPTPVFSEVGRTFRKANDHSAFLGLAPLFLEELTAALGVAKTSMSLNLREQRFTKGDRYLSAEGFTFELTRPDGTIIHHDRLSYGQKRLLAFYYYLACNPAVVIADELVNGLHHHWIESCMKAIGERQAFLTSQNPLLFDYVEFESVEQVRSRFITCKLEQAAGREYMVWENMSEADATRFFDAYQAGIEHVGDILITRGMW